MENETNLNGTNSEIHLDFKFVLKIYLFAHASILNLIVVLIICIKLKKNFSNIALLSLAISDLVIGCFVIPSCIFAEYFYEFFRTLSIYCLVYRVIDNSSSTVSLLSLLILTFHRYSQITRPFEQNEKITWKRLTLLISIWFLNYLFWVMFILIKNRFSINSESCYIYLPFNQVIILDLVFQVFPYLVLVAFNILLLRKLYIRSRKNVYMRSNNTFVSKKEKNAIKCVSFITISLISCWSLYAVIWPLDAYYELHFTHPLIELSYWLNYISSGINPIILIIFNSNIKKRFCKILRCSFTRKI
jgi:hypothetical protein